MTRTADDARYLDLAARFALRGMGDVEPNPMVGCVIVRDGRIIGAGHHRRFGGPHAEREALADCAARGESPEGSTIYVTLEPCRHTGKTPPCTDAVIRARPARVVIARPDPGERSGGGAELLRSAGIHVDFTSAGTLAQAVSDPFIKRVRTGLPWVIAKWAQTIDGRIATRHGESKWISAEVSRRAVHRLRARVDAVLTGIGTVRADDPLLTARGVPRVRRVAARIVIDPAAELSPDSALVRSAADAPVIVVHSASDPEAERRAGHLQTLGVRPLAVNPAPPAPGGGEPRLDLRAALAGLAAEYNLTTVLVEAGPRLVGSLLAQALLDEVRVFVGPVLLGDQHALPPASDAGAVGLSSAPRFTLVRARRLGPDAELWYRRA